MKGLPKTVRDWDPGIVFNNLASKMLDIAFGFPQSPKRVINRYGQELAFSKVTMLVRFLPSCARHPPLAKQHLLDKP
jgi:hypothetical protein